MPPKFDPNEIKIGKISSRQISPFNYRNACMT